MTNTCQNYALAIHATGATLGLAIANFNGDRRSQTWNLGRDLSNQFHTQLIDFVNPQTWGNLMFIAVAKGPGSFTSTRIGVVAARTLAQQLELPLFAISNLAAVAWAHPNPDEILAVQQPARREQIFVAIYQKCDRGLQPLLPDTATTLSAWQEKLSTLKSEYQLLEAAEDSGDTVESILELAHLGWQANQRPHWSEALPFYGQHPIE